LIILSIFDSFIKFLDGFFLHEMFSRLDCRVAASTSASLFLQLRVYFQYQPLNFKKCTNPVENDRFAEGTTCEEISCYGRNSHVSGMDWKIEKNRKTIIIFYLCKINIFEYFISMKKIEKIEKIEKS